MWLMLNELRHTGPAGPPLASAWDMRIEPHANLTITLLERHLFGSDRLAGSVPRREVPIAHVHLADRCRVVPGALSAEAKACDPVACDAPAGAVGLVTPTTYAIPAETTEPTHNPASADPSNLQPAPAERTVGTLLDVMA